MMTQSPRCWCGNASLEPFSDDYLRCPQCETLVLAQPPESDLIPSSGTEQAYYGKEYWFSHQEQVLGLPNILTRARTDLVDRIPYWLEKILRHRLPPGRALELGCSHGGFAAMLGVAGFDAAGLEISPWIVEFARQAFSIPMYQGLLEQQQIPEATHDLVVMMDVLEHLPDPLDTLRSAVRILRPGGLVIIQTPAYPTGKSLDELKAVAAPFLNMLLPGEHLYLFSEQSLQRLLSAAGLSHFHFEPAVYPYDQFLFASTRPVPQYSAEEVAQALQQGKGGRLSQALIDLFQRLQQVEQMYQQADRDREGRLEQMETLDHLLQVSEADRRARLERMNELAAKIEEMETSLSASRARVRDLEKKATSLEQERSFLLYQAVDTHKAITDLQGTFFYRAMRHLRRTRPFEAALAAIPQPETPHPLRRIAVDLTPIRPGGENGGMKLFAQELVLRFSRQVAPEIEYILLTSSDTHDELAFLDAPNVRRICVNQVTPAPVTTQSAPAAAQPVRRSPARRVIHAGAQVLERVLPPETFRKIYHRYRQQVQEPSESNFVRTLDIDLMFCPFTAVFYSAPGVPTVVVVADLQYRYYPQFFTVEQNFHADNNFRKVCQVATRLICLSDFTRQTVIEQGKVAPEQAVTIYPSFWSALSVQPAEQVKLALEKWHLEESQYLFFPANFWPHKNHAMLLTAFNMFCHLHPESSLKLVLSGAPGERMSALQKAASQMGLSERVVFTGYLRPPEVSALLQGCLALIFPSLFEGFGMPALEAMQFGKPVLCSQATSLPEVCGEAALYFDPRLPGEMLGAIENLVGDPGLAFHLAEKGRQQALRFNDPAAWAENNFQVLEDTFQRKRVFHDGVDGLYEDGWAGPWLEISSAGGIGRQLDIELEAPAWLPQKLTVSITGKVVKALEEQIPPGGKRALSLPLAASGGIVQLKFYPSISPLELHHNQDQRKLSCRINSCRLKSGGVELDLLNKEPQ